MIEHVQPGQSIRASTVNAIIDATTVGSDTLDVQQTTSGTRINLPNNWKIEGNTQNKIFSVRQGQISGYPYATINMGTSLEECLGAVKIHESDTVTNPLCALVVYRNSAQSPDQNHLTGYVLSSNQFGWDARIGSTGWLSTKMEWNSSQFQKDIDLGIWRADTKRYMVFTNVDDLSDLKDEISVQLMNAGEDQDKLSTLTRDWNFTLLKCSLLSGVEDGTPWYKPTKQIVHNDGEVHVWNGEAGITPVIWKADMVCFKKNDDERSFCWKMWLGPDSTYDQSLQRVLVRAQDGDQFALSAVEVNDIGQVDGTNVMESPYGGYDVLWGSVTADVGTNVSEQSAYLNLTYDKSKAYLDSYLDVEPDTTTQLSTDGLIRRSIFIAKTSEFMAPNADVAEKVSDNFIQRGTWGDLDFGAPKLDSYVPATDSTTSKSLDWSVPQTDNRRPCEPHVMQLHDFANGYVTNAEETDEVLVRREDTQGNKELKYVTLSSIGGMGCSCEMSAENFTYPELVAQWRHSPEDNWLSIYTPSCWVEQTLSSGTKIAEFHYDTTTTEIYAPSSTGGCSCDLTAELTSGTKIATWTKDGVNMVDVYAPSGGGGGDVSCYTTLSGNVDQSQKIWGDIQFQAMTSSNVSVQTTIENGVPICRIGVFYL